MRTLLLVVPIVLAAAACIGPSTRTSLDEHLAAARAASTAEERDEQLEAALAKLEDALKNQPREASAWIVGLVLGLLGVGGGVGVAVQSKKAAAAAALAALRSDSTDRPAIGPQSGGI